MPRLYKKIKRLLLPLCFLTVFVLMNGVNFRGEELRGYSKSRLNRYENSTKDTITRDSLTEGYTRAKRLVQRCISDNNTSFSEQSVRLNMIYQTTSGDLELCPVWKAGSTFIKRLFMMINGHEYMNSSTPFDISFLSKYPPIKGLISNSPETRRFVFVRNPYSRLLSGYIDKLYGPNPVYWGMIGTRAIRLMRQSATEKSRKCGHDLTFREYVQYAILALTPGNTYKATPDSHFEQISRLCKPCQVKYNFIGKMESFRLDCYELMEQLNMTGTGDLLKDKMEELAADDALRDTLSQPFDETFKTKFKGCVSFTEVLKRAWTKLQMRGLVGRQPLELSDENITKDEIIELARNARRASTVEERKKLKQYYFNNFYLSLNKGELDKIRTIYSDDFKLFEYYNRPAYIFSES